MMKSYKFDSQRGNYIVKTKKITLAYFSGTGCTKEVCLCFVQELTKKGLESKTINLESHDPDQKLNKNGAWKGVRDYLK